MSTGDDNVDLTGVKVLVIDDSKTIRRTAENLLAKAGCEVITAADGFEALGKIVDGRPSVQEQLDIHSGPWPWLQQMGGDITHAHCPAVSIPGAGEDSVTNGGLEFIQ